MLRLLYTRNSHLYSDMTPFKRQGKETTATASLGLPACEKSRIETTEKGFSFQYMGCWKVECLPTEKARLN